MAAPARKTAAPQAQKAVQPPLMQDVSQAEEDLKPDFVPEADAKTVTLDADVAHFAAAIGHVEALARLGNAELVMQVARIAYTRGRQSAREQGQEA